MSLEITEFFKLGLMIMFMTSCLTTVCAQHNGQVSIKEGWVEVTGGKVWYRISGYGKEGVPLLVLHGGPGAPHDYLISLEELADQRPVVFYDQLGCGNSDRSEDTSLWTVERFVEELECVRDALKLKEIHLLGQSWGSMLAVEYILRRKPEGIHSLVLSAPFLSTPLWAADQRKLIAQLDPEIQNTIVACEAEGNYASDEYQAAMMSFYQRHLCRLDPWPDNLISTMEKMGLGVYEYMWGPSEFTTTGTLKQADLTRELKNLTLPTLLTCGEYDEATPQTTKFYQSLIPGSEIKIFSNASHEHHYEQKEAYNKLLRNFCEKHEHQ